MADIGGIFAAGRKYSALPAGLAPLLAVWLASLAGLFDVADGLLYDGLYRLQPASGRQSRVLVVEAGSAAGADWMRLLERLPASGAQPVVFDFLPDDASPAFYRKASAAGVIFGRRPVVDADAAGGGHWQDLPAAATGMPLQHGLLPPPEQDHGVYRSHWLRSALYDETGDSPFLLAARQAGAAGIPDTPTFNLNLRGGSARLFRLPLAQALDGGLVPELTAGRALLVSLGRGNDYGLYTPVGVYSPAVYEGLALDTLLSGQAVSRSGFAAMVPATALAVLLGLVLFQAVPAQAGLWLCLGMAAAYGAGAWAALQYAAFWPPLAEILAAHFLAFILQSRHRLLREDRRVGELVAGLDAKLSERVAPESFYQAEDHWAYVATMVQQYFNLRRTIFLERVPEDHRLREIKAIGCSLEDIDEKRRDYERTPYSTAIAELAPIRLDRSYLKKGEAEEDQYLVPLIFAGEVLGFWALTVAPTAEGASPAFLRLVDSVADQLSQLLHYRRRWRQQEAELRRPVQAYMRLEGAEELSHRLRTCVALLGQRLSRLQEIFDVLPGYCILYDLFGRSLIINRRMESLARQLSLKPYEKTVAELIAELTGQTMQQVQDMLQYVILRGGELTLPVSMADGRFFLLNLKPMRGEERHPQGTAGPDDVPQPMDRHGVLLALEDVTRFKAIDDLKDSALERLFFQLRNDLTAIYLSVGLLDAPALPEPQRREVLETVQGKLDGITPMLAEMQNELAAGWGKLLDGTLARYPVDGLEPLREALALLGEENTRPDVRIELRCPQLMSLVLAAPDQLQGLFETLLRLQLEDTRPEGRLAVNVEESGGLVRYRFTNTGLGLPAESLRASLENPAAAGGRLAGLRQAMELAERWGGELAVDSELGDGLRFTLALQAFLAPRPAPLDQA